MVPVRLAPALNRNVSTSVSEPVTFSRPLNVVAVASRLPLSLPVIRMTRGVVASLIIRVSTSPPPAMFPVRFAPSLKVIVSLSASPSIPAATTPLTVTLSVPVPVLTVPATELPVASVTTSAPSPVRTSPPTDTFMLIVTVSTAPSPLIAPSSVTPACRMNSSMAAPPVRFSTFRKPGPAVTPESSRFGVPVGPVSSPVFVPVTVNCAPVDGPVNVSLSAPPSTEPVRRPLVDTLNVSSPAPPARFSMSWNELV